jgi:hypothetical protein
MVEFMLKSRLCCWLTFLKIQNHQSFIPPIKTITRQPGAAGEKHFAEWSGGITASSVIRKVFL